MLKFLDNTVKKRNKRKEGQRTENVGHGWSTSSALYGWSKY